MHRNPIRHWLALYKTGGLEALLAVYVPAGKPVFLPQEVLNALEQALRQPCGCASYEARRQWVQPTHHREVTYQTLYTIFSMRWPANVRAVWWPPYCPELNPIERVWRDRKDALAWLQFPTLDAQQDYVGQLLRAYEASTLQSLTSYAYLVEAIHALTS